MQHLTTFTVITSLLLSPVVLAQSATETETETTATINSFDDLSSGNKMIARSLMDAQTLPPDSTVQPWSLDDIAAARSETGWGNVFKQMQAEGLVEAKNLGEVVSAHARATHHPVTESVAVEAGIPADTTAGEPADDNAITEPPEDVDGAFDNLSTGNKKIARSLMDAQTLPADGTSEPWTLDQIATAKGDTGWGNVFKQMQSEGLVEARNLGQVVSQYQHQNLAVTTGTSAAVSTAAASPAGDRLPDQASGKANGHVDSGSVAAASPGNGNAAGITTAAGSTNGNAYGLGKHTVSASEGITTAGSATVGTNAAHGAGIAASGNGNAAVSANSASTAGNSAAAASVTTAGGGNTNGNAYAYGKTK